MASAQVENGADKRKAARLAAMDELAVALNMDPVELRIVNDPDVDPETGKPWSGRHLVECLRTGAQRFEWSARDPEPGKRVAGEWLSGTGVGLVVTPVLSLLLGPVAGVLLTNAVTTVSGFTIMLSVRKRVDWRRAGIVVASALPGAVLGALLVLWLFAGMGFIGFLDDWTKISKQRSLGLKPRGKLIGQAIVAIVLLGRAGDGADQLGTPGADHPGPAAAGDGARSGPTGRR